MWRGILRALFVATFAAYVIWNAWWLLRGAIPPSMLTGLTSVPAPTTGGTRAMLALWQGEFQRSLQFNPLAVPFCLTLVLSLAQLSWNWFRGERVILRKWLVWTWLAVLLLGWVAKFVVAEPS
jgi:hypothetical protein